MHQVQTRFSNSISCVSHLISRIIRGPPREFLGRFTMLDSSKSRLTRRPVLCPFIRSVDAFPLPHVLEKPPLFTPLLRNSPLTSLVSFFSAPLPPLQALFNNVRHAERSRCGPQPRSDGAKNKNARDRGMYVTIWRVRRFFRPCWWTRRSLLLLFCLMFTIAACFFFFSWSRH